jgi:hypothetical protein
MKKSIYTSIALSAFISISSFAMEEGVSEVSTMTAQKSWEESTREFHQAFLSGDVAKLESLRKTPGFANINDLGPGFSRYGSSLDNWDLLISDAREVCKTTDLNANFIRFIYEFEIAFNNGNIKRLMELKNVRGFANINDLGGHFMEYGPGLDNWEKLMEDARNLKVFLDEQNRLLALQSQKN